MKVLIIEDEPLSADRIKTLLHQYDKSISIMAMLDSVKSAVEWFNENENPDLIFMDIQLADGLSFEIFSRIKIELPIIFTTAYQEYAIQAFKVNSVDYLLKPVVFEELVGAISKYESFFIQKQKLPVISEDILNSVKHLLSHHYKNRFAVKIGDRIKSVDVKDIHYFYSMEKGTYLHTKENRNYAIDYTLDGLGDLLDPSLFFRINRKYIISHSSILEVITLSGTKLKIKLTASDDSKIYISRERLYGFKKWLGN
ncbi:LytR/AlgR family response regulator transcription factor [Bacteroidota bacterium]